MLTLTDATFLYAEACGIRGATLRVAPGEVVGVVGANGAGKSTLLGLAAAALVPQAGTVQLALTDLAGRTRKYRSDQGIGYRRHVGYMTELAPAYAEMRVERYLRFRAKLRGERFLRIRRRVKEALERCGLMAARRRTIGKLSLGMRRRVALAEALLTMPPVLVLDDPFAGIDAAMRADFAEVIKEVSPRAHVLISGHDPALLGACCTRFALVERGRVAEASLDAAAAMARLLPEPASEGQGRA